MNRNDLTQGPVLRSLIMFFLPIAGGNIVQQLYNTVDSLIVGRWLGTKALAAVGGSSAYVVTLIVGFCIALTAGASVVVSHYYGSKDFQSASSASNTAVAACFFIGLAVSLAGIISAKAILRFMGTPSDTIEDSAVYLRTIFFGTTFVVVYNMCANILRASGDSRRPFVYLLCSSVTNIVLDLLFVTVFGWGVFGAAFATVISQVLSCVLALIRMFTADEFYRMRLSGFRLDVFNLKKMMRIGVPNALQASMYNLSNAWIMIFVNSLGTVAVAAWSLTGKVDGFFWVTANAMGSAVLSFVGQNYGAGRTDRVKECIKKALVAFIAGTLVFSALLMTLGTRLIPLFDSNPDVIDTTVLMMTWFVPFYFLWPVVEIFTSVLRGIGDAVVPVIILGITVCAFRIVWLYTVFSIFHTIPVLCICYAISWVLAAVPLIIRYRRLRIG